MHYGIGFNNNTENKPGKASIDTPKRLMLT